MTETHNGFAYSYYGCLTPAPVTPVKLNKDMATDDWKTIASVALQYVLGSNYLSKEYGVAFDENGFAYLGYSMDLDSYQWTKKDIKRSIATMNALNNHLTKFVDGEDAVIVKKWQSVLKNTKAFLKSHFKDDKQSYLFAFATNSNDDLSDEELIEVLKTIISSWIAQPKMFHNNSEKSVLICGVLSGNVHRYALSGEVKHDLIGHYSAKYIKPSKSSVPPYAELNALQRQQVEEEYSQMTGHPNYDFAYNAGGLMVEDWFNDLRKAFKLLFGTKANQIKLYNEYKSNNNYFSPRFWGNQIATYAAISHIDNDLVNTITVDLILEKIRETEKMMTEINKVLKNTNGIKKLQRAGFNPVVIQSVWEVLKEVAHQDNETCVTNVCFTN